MSFGFLFIKRGRFYGYIENFIGGEFSWDCECGYVCLVFGIDLVVDKC